MPAVLKKQERVSRTRVRATSDTVLFSSSTYFSADRDSFVQVRSRVVVPKEVVEVQGVEHEFQRVEVEVEEPVSRIEKLGVHNVWALEEEVKVVVMKIILKRAHPI